MFGRKKNPAAASTENAGPASGTKKEKKSLSEVQIPNWLAAVLIVGLIAVIAVVFFLKNSGGTQAIGTTFAEEPSSEATAVEVLPQRVRSFSGGEVSNPFTSDMIGNVQLTGIVSNSAGKSTVILQTDQASYIVSEGDTLPESEWVVSKVGSNFVTFALNGNEKTIWMSGASESENQSADSKATSKSTSGVQK